jgi:hypothetical protein
MIGSKSSNTAFNIFSALQDQSKGVKKYFYVLCAFWLMVSTLEFAQDYIGSILNDSSFYVFESLSYKLFWLLFIPSTFALGYGLKKLKTKANFNKPLYFIFYGLLILFISLTHLIVFSFLLFGISNLIHEDLWHLPWLLAEKFSTRLYIALTIYIVLTAVYFWIEQKESKRQSEQEEYSKTMTVRNGRKSVIIPVDTIKWINSDSPYLFIHTPEKKHITSDTLKNIITTLPENFKRIHRSTIVNINMVKELRSRLNGDYDVILHDSSELRLSRNFTDNLKGIFL